MKTIKEWVLNEYEMDTIKDIYNHGINGGFSGMTYYIDTVAFHDKYESEIWDMLNEDADSQGCTIIELIASFGCKNNVGSMEQFKNLLSWYSVERVCSLIVDECEAVA